MIRLHCPRVVCAVWQVVIKSGLDRRCTQSTAVGCCGHQRRQRRHLWNDEKNMNTSSGPLLSASLNSSMSDLRDGSFVSVQTFQLPMNKHYKGRETSIAQTHPHSPCLVFYALALQYYADQKKLFWSRKTTKTLQLLVYEFKFQVLRK